MKKGGQKAKSNAHQRRVAGLFTSAYYPTDDGLFKSTPGSGGWDKRAAPGDVIAFKYIDEETKEMGRDKTFPMNIECKDWRGESVKHFFSGLYSDESQLFGWMEQAWEDALLIKKMPIVVFKLYRTENVVMLLSTDFYSLTNYFGNFVGKIYTIEKIMPKEQKSHKEKTIKHSRGETTFLMHQELIFILLKDFLEWIEWELFKSGKITDI